jgi:hypothetical protein
MSIYQEKIVPPRAPPNDDEQKKVRVEAIVSGDRWVENFIGRLAGVIRDIKR